VERWFIKSRRSLARCTKDKDHEDEMLLQSLDNSRQVRQSPAVCTREAASQSKQPSPPSGQWRSGDLDYVPVLLDSETPSLPSELSTQISMTCFSSYGSQKRPVSPTFNDAISRELSLLCSHMLVLATLNILIGGTSCKRSLQHVALESAFPETSLSNLAPALFRPGFKQLMAHNSRFLPSILCAISSSWVRNCQGPGLRATLIELSNSTPPVSDYGNIAEAGVQGSVERLSAVVQGRMWRMMHKKLSDAAICRKITWESVDPTRIIDAEDAVTDEDLLGSRRAEGQKGIYLSPGKDLQECITDGYIDGDDLLLFDAMSDDEGLLSYFDEMEKLEVEKQTDEMLFGSENCEDEGDTEIVLLLDGDAEDTMLL
jgi:hypothetical protein